MRQRSRPLSAGTDQAALRFLKALTGKFPSFIGEVTDSYEIRMRLDDVLAHRNMGPDTIRVEHMAVDKDNREFSAICVPQDGCSMLRLTHIGIPVQGTRDGYLYRSEEMAQICGLQVQAIRSVLPVQNGMAHVELTVPIMMSAKVPPDAMRDALRRVCQAAEQGGSASDAAQGLTETEIALQGAERALEAEVIRLRGKNKSLLDIESMTAGLRDTVHRLKQECEEERKSSAVDSENTPPPAQIVNPAAPYAQVGDGLTVTGVQSTFTAWLSAQRQAGVNRITATEIYGTAPGVRAPAAHVRIKDDTVTTDVDGLGAIVESRPDVLLGHVIEHTLMQDGWIGRHEDGCTVWVLPACKEVTDVPAPVLPAAISGEGNVPRHASDAAETPQEK